MNNTVDAKKLFDKIVDNFKDIAEMEKEKVWEFAKLISLMNYEEIKNIFGYNDASNVFFELSVDEAQKIYDDYQREESCKIKNIVKRWI